MLWYENLKPMIFKNFITRSRSFILALRCETSISISTLHESLYSTETFQRFTIYEMGRWSNCAAKDVFDQGLEFRLPLNCNPRIKSFFNSSFCTVFGLWKLTFCKNFQGLLQFPASWCITSLFAMNQIWISELLFARTDSIGLRIILDFV